MMKDKYQQKIPLSSTEAWRLYNQGLEVWVSRRGLDGWHIVRDYKFSLFQEEGLEFSLAIAEEEERQRVLINQQMSKQLRRGAVFFLLLPLPFCLGILFKLGQVEGAEKLMWFNQAFTATAEFYFVISGLLALLGCHFFIQAHALENQYRDWINDICDKYQISAWLHHSGWKQDSSKNKFY